MRRISIALLIALVLSVALSGQVLAAPGGMPAAHGVDGRTFGGAVSGLATTDPGALAAHVSGCGACGGQGMPALHGVDGPTFGGLVSGLARTNPGALAAHVSGR